MVVLIAGCNYGNKVEESELTTDIGSVNNTDTKTTPTEALYPESDITQNANKISNYKVVYNMNMNSGDFYDGAFYKKENGKEILLTDSIIKLTPGLAPNEALYTFASPTNGQIVFNSGIPMSDNAFGKLYAYNKDTKTFKPFTDVLIILGMQRSPKQDKASFIGENAIRIFDLIALQELDPIKIPEGEFINNPTLDGLGPNMFPPMEWLDESTFKYSTFKKDGSLTQERIINF